MSATDPENPQLLGTQKDYAWDAWQKAFDANTRMPDHAKFLAWWEATALTTAWKSTHDMLRAAWIAGVEDFVTQSTGGFNAWWQEILDSQPKIV